VFLLADVKRKRDSHEVKDSNRVVDIRYRAIHNAVIAEFGEVEFKELSGGNRAYFLSEDMIVVFTSAAEVRAKAKLFKEKLQKDKPEVGDSNVRV